jgi:hypothetical protein
MGLSYSLACGGIIGAKTMNESLTSNGATCFTTGGKNVVLDCNGYSVTSNNTTGTFGILSTHSGTKVKNCIFNGFSTGIQYQSTNGTIDNVSINTTMPTDWGSNGAGIYFYPGANSNVVNNSRITASAGNGVLVMTAYNNTVLNTNISNTALGIIVTASANTTIRNAIVSSTSNIGVYISSSTGNTVSSSSITAAASWAAFADKAGGAIYSTNNTFFNNTLSSPNSLGLGFDAGSGNNVICLNNLTNIGSDYINDLNGSNTYNCTHGGKVQGNIYSNVMDGSITAYGSVASSIPGLYIGTTGSGVPYNNTTSGGKFTCSFAGCGDKYPLTSNAIASCMALSLTNATYTLSANASINGSNCFNVTAANVTLDCNGYSITGNNTNNSLGIETTQYNTTIRNCNISGFHTAIRLNGASYSTIDNTTATSTLATVISDTFGRGISIDGDYNTVTNSRASAVNGALVTFPHADFNTITNTNVTGTSPEGSYSLWLYLSDNNIIRNVAVSGHHDQYGAMMLFGSANNLVANSTVNGLGAWYALALNTVAGNINNTFINNTLLNASHATLLLDGGAGSNTFCLNNLTSGTSTYVTDLNGSNSYNCTYDGKNQGNAYENVVNGSIWAYGNNASSIAGLYIGTAGTGVPYNNSTSNGRFACSFAGCADYAPLTSISGASCANISSPGASYLMTGNVSINGATCFTITASNVTLDCNGYSITGNNTTTTYGVYTNQTGGISNLTVKNCAISNFKAAVWAQNANNSLYQNLTLSSTNTASQSHGIILNAGSFNTIDGVTATSNGGIGIYSSATYNTVIQNSHGTSYLATSAGIDLLTSSNARLINSTGDGYSTTGHGIRIRTASTNVTIINSTGTSHTSGDGITIRTTTNSTLINVTGIACNTSGISIQQTSSNVSVTGATVAVTCDGADSRGIYLNSAVDSTVDCNGGAVTGIGTSKSGLLMSGTTLGGTHDNTIKNCLVDGFVNGISVNTTNASYDVNDNTFMNNTVMNSTTSLYAGATTSSNTFCWNNITSIGSPSSYATDLNGSNNYNGTACNGEGNVWANVINGSIKIQGNATSIGYPSFYVGINGTGYPYNETTSGGMMTGGTDYAPLTTGTISITYLTLGFPSNYTAFQRDNDTAGELKICGNYTGDATSIEANTGSGWQALYSGTVPNPFCTFMNQSMGAFNLSIRANQDNSTMKTAYFLTVGDVFLIVGQSNAAGGSPNYTSVNASNPYPSSQFKYSTEVWTAPMLQSCYGGGNPWWGMVNKVSQNQSIPVSLICMAVSGSAISCWQNISAVDNNTMLNGACWRVMLGNVTKATNGTMKVKSVLFFQGESGYPTNYPQNLTAAVNDILSITNPVSSKKLLMGQVSVCWQNVNNADIDIIRRVQRDAYLNNSSIGAGAVSYHIPKTDGLNCHYYATSEIAALSDQWAHSVLGEVYGAGDGRGAQPISAAISGGDTSLLNITFDKPIGIMDYLNNKSSARAYGFRVLAPTFNLTDNNITYTNVSGSSVLVKFTSGLNESYNISYALSLDTNGANVSNYNQSTGGKPVLVTANDVPVMTMYNYPLTLENVTQPDTFANLSVICGAGGATCLGNVTDINTTTGANSSINATAATNYTFSNWSVTSGNCTIGNTSSNTTTANFINTTANCVVQANFNHTQSTTANLTVTCGTGGSSCTGSDTNFTTPANKTIGANALTDYTFNSWSITNGNCTINNALAASTYAIFTNTTSSCNVTASFDYTPPATGTLNVKCGAGGSVCTGNATGISLPGNKSINATASVNYTFSNWSVVSGGCTLDSPTLNVSTAYITTSTPCVVQANFNESTPPTTTCGNLSTPGTTYTMTTDLSINGSTCFNITASNVTLDCNGYSMTGDTTPVPETMGVYSEHQTNVTIRNCDIRTFYAGIYFSNESHSLIENTSINLQTSEEPGIYMDASSEFNLIRNSTIFSNTSNAVFFSLANNNTIANSTLSTVEIPALLIGTNTGYITVTGSRIYSDVALAVETYGSTYSNTISGSSIESTQNTAMTILDSHGSFFENNNITSPTTGVTIMSGAGNTFIGCNVTADLPFGIPGEENLTVINSLLDGWSYGIYIQTGTTGGMFANLSMRSVTYGIRMEGGTGNMFINNTINGSMGIWASNTTGNNTFCLNNLTGATYYVNDTAGSNFYNCSYDGKNQGNIWGNVVNGSVNVTGTNASSIAGLYIGSAGAVPYNNTTSAGKFICNFLGCGDYAPLTPFAPLAACMTSFGFQTWMTPDGQIITRYTNSATTWMAQFLNATENRAGCFANITAYATTRLGALIGAVFTTSTGNLTLNHTNIPVNSTFNLYSVAMLANGSNITTETRQYYIIGQSISNTQGGITMADIVTGLIILGGLMWLSAAYIYLQRKAVAIAFPFYIFGIILFITATVAAAEASASVGSYGTMNMMFMLMIGLQWLLLISLAASFLYIMIMIIDWLAKLINVKLEKRNLEGHL